MGRQPAAAAASRSLLLANGFIRGVFIGCGRPSVHTTRLAISAGGPPGWSARASSMARRAPGSGTVSSSISQTRSASPASASARPYAKPPAPPVLRCAAASRTDGKRVRTRSAVPSVEALSITITVSGARVCPSTADSASVSRSRRL